MKNHIHHQKNYTASAIKAELLGDIEINDYITILFFSSLLAVIASVALYMFVVSCI